MKEQNYPHRLIVIVGPTASGKSSLAIEVAKHYGAPIISTDSRQIYRGIPIGTAQPTAEELAEAEHHFIAEREIADEYNAGRYEEDALRRLEELFAQQNTVVAVGGSGLYIRALCEGLDALPEVSSELREGLRRELVEGGLEPLLEELKGLDPDFYALVDRANSSRVLRALEVCRASGKPYSSFRRGEAKRRDFQIIKIGLDLPREMLYERIDRRVDEMISQGLEAEARGVYHLRHHNSLQTVGYRELFDYFSGECDLPRAVELIKRNSRRYAKRQMTWFRRESGVQWFSSGEIKPIIDYITEKS